MRSALTLVRLHGEANFGTVSGPEVHIAEQVANFKGLQASGKVHPEIAEAQLWVSDAGITKRIRFQMPAPVVSSDPEAPADPPKRGRGRPRTVITKTS